VARPGPLTRRRTTRLDALLAGVIALLVASALVPLTAAWGGRDWDQFEADLLSARRSLLVEHELPLWMPFRGGGHDAWADPQSLWCSPLGLLVLALGLRWGVCAFFALAAGCGVLGVQRLGAELGLGAAGRNLAAVALFLNPPLGLYAAGGIPPFVLGLAVLPWVAWCLLRDEPRAWVLGGALLALDLYAGDVNHFLFHSVFLGLLGAALAALRRRPRVLLRVLVVGLAAGVFAAPKLAPTVLLARHNPRVVDASHRGALTLRLTAHVLLDRGATGSCLAGPYSEFVALTRTGELANRDRPAPPEELLPGTAVDWVNVGHYQGPLVLVFALGGLLLIVLRRRRSEPGRPPGAGADSAFAALALAGGGMLWLAWGSNAWPSAWDGLHRLPVFSSTRSPGKLILYALLPLSLFAGVALDAVARRLVRSRVEPRVASAIAGLLVGLVLLDVHPPARAAYRRAFCEPPRPLQLDAEGGFRSVAVLQPAGSTHYGPPVRPCVEAGVGAVNGYTAVPLHPSAVPVGAPGYRGEAFPLDPSAPGVRTWRFTSRRIALELEPSDRPRAVIVNANWGPGWRVEAPGGATCSAHDDARIRLSVPPGTESVRLVYTPPGLWAGLLVFLLGVPAIALALSSTRGVGPPRPTLDHEKTVLSPQPPASRGS